MGNIIKKTDLVEIYDKQVHLQNIKEKFRVGVYVRNKNISSCSNSIYLLTEKTENRGFGGFKCIEYNPIDLSIIEENHTISDQSLEEYYIPISDIEGIKNFALKLLQGDEFEDIQEPTDENSLMALNSSQTLEYLKKETEKALAIAEEVRQYAKGVIEFQKKELDAKIQVFNNKISVMKKEIETFEYVITTIEIYAGIKEDIITLKEGEPASADCLIVLRQAALYMDEEFALMDDDFDYTKIKNFDSWLVENNHFKNILPDEKSMLVCKPRRTNKQYKQQVIINGKHKTIDISSFENWMLNRPNHKTIFLIRNGENLYKLESENIAVEDKLFPNKNEYQELINKENNKDDIWNRDDKHEKSTNFRKLYTRIIFLIQGLLDRSNVFSPHNIDINLLKNPNVDESKLILRYELDNILGDGHPSYEEWVKKLNSNLHEGKRIILCGYDFSADEDFIRYYANKWSIPSLPQKGIYVLEKNPNIKKKEQGHYVSPTWLQPFIIRYFPDGEQRFWKDYWGDEHSSNRVSIQIDPERTPYYGILNYDDITLEDIDYYLNSRIHRSKYFQFVYSLKLAKELYLKEKALEDEFIKMMIGILQKENVQLKDGFTYEEVIREAIKDFKDSLKWKRSIVDKTKQTFFILKEKILGYDFKKKYFK